MVDSMLLRVVVRQGDAELSRGGEVGVVVYVIICF